MPKPAEVPAAAGKRMCGICNKPLSQYNRDDICMSHKAEAIAKYRKKVDVQAKESRAMFAFIAEFHRAGSAKDMFEEAKQTPLTPFKRRGMMELERSPEALGLLKLASMIFRLTMPGILRKSTDPAKGLKARLARDVLAYLMKQDLDMTNEDIAAFLGYTYVPRVNEGVRRIAAAMHAEDLDEDIICAVDVIRNERDLHLAEEA